MKKQLIIFICLVFLTISIICESNNDDQTIINLLKKKGIVLSEEKPSEDYHSPKEAVLNCYSPINFSKPCPIMLPILARIA